MDPPHPSTTPVASPSKRSKPSSGGTYGAYLEEEERATREKVSGRALEITDVVVRSLASQSHLARKMDINEEKGKGRENEAVQRLFECVGEILVFLGESAGEPSNSTSVDGDVGKKVQVNQKVAEFVVHFIRGGTYLLWLSKRRSVLIWCILGDEAFKTSCVEGCVGVIGEAAAAAVRGPALTRSNRDGGEIIDDAVPSTTHEGGNDEKTDIDRENSSPFIFDDPPPPSSLVEEVSAEKPHLKAKTRLKILGGTMMIIACAVVGEWCELLLSQSRDGEGKKEVDDVCRVLCGMLDDDAGIGSGKIGVHCYIFELTLIRASAAASLQELIMMTVLRLVAQLCVPNAKPGGLDVGVLSTFRTTLEGLAQRPTSRRYIRNVRISYLSLSMRD